MHRLPFWLILGFTVLSANAKPLAPEDYAGLRDVSDPQISPDGRWVAYCVATTDTAKDKRPKHLWLAAWDGSENRALTFGDKGQSHPRWSPDGKWLAFLSSREDDNENSQLWLLPREGGEAERLTETTNGVDDFAWAPDSRRLVLVVKDLDPQAEAARKAEKDKKTAPPIVIDRYFFKEDITGYLTANYDHLALFDIEKRRTVALTSGHHDELLPTWSPDGSAIAYVTKRGDDPDRTENWDVYLIAPQKSAPERTLVGTQASTFFTSLWGDSDPMWSPDSKSVAFLRGGAPKEIEYATNSLGTVSVDGTAVRDLSGSLDRNLSHLNWSADGHSLYALCEDDGAMTLVRFPADGTLPNPARETVVGGRRDIRAYSVGPREEIAVLCSTQDQPSEIYAVEAGGLRAITHQNDAWLKTVELGPTLETRFSSSDGTEVHGFIIRPPGAKGATPALLRPHGGPQSQYTIGFSFEAQLFATNGYTVILPNPRGSSGRGRTYALGIYAAWGTVDVQDDLAAVDDAVKRGLADPERLGVGGWSYGGMSTNYLIASTTRFKAATSGASISNVLAGFGTDEYVRDYINELGAPWEHPDTWMKISYPYLHADRIKTPTLFLGGQSDFNVPLLNVEQMYQALRQLHVPATLVIYPGQNHALGKPSYVIDRYHRYLDWYAQWIPRSP